MMQCSTCPNTPLVISEFRGVELRSCPRCRVVWLGREAFDTPTARPIAMPPAPTRSAVRSPLRLAVPGVERPLAYQGSRKKPWLSDVIE
jgi:Zn-finger nucleic acid-binding protein